MVALFVSCGGYEADAVEPGTDELTTDELELTSRNCTNVETWNCAAYGLSCRDHRCIQTLCSATQARNCAAYGLRCSSGRCY
jgi:hypothetical protein